MRSLTWAGRIAAATVQSTPRQVGAVPVIYPILEELRVRDTINALRQTGADIDLGRLVEILTLNRLMAPQPLYRVGKWAAQIVVMSMFGLAAQKLYDQRFGRALDDLHPILGEAWVALAARVVQQEGIDLSAIHWDTTSVCLEGEYEDSELAAYGHSSDHRSGNKQVKVGLDVTSRERMPLLYRLLDGSTADITTPVPNLRAIAAFLRRPECAGMAVHPKVDLTGSDRRLTLSFRIDREALAQAQALDGKYLLGTNASHLSASEALAYFKAQDGVEKRNGDFKGPLRVRPLHLHSDRRIEGLVFITLLALLVHAILELRCRRAGLNYTADRVLRAFAPLYATDQVFVDGSRLTQLGEMTPFQQRVLDGLHFPSPTRYLHNLPA
jgi:transposase